MKKILILDANQRSALAATRALGKKGIAVVTGDATRRTLAGSSKYCQECIVYPSPYDAPDDFVTWLAETIKRSHIDVLFPMTDVTTAVVLKHQAQLGSVCIAAPSFDAYDSVTDKFRLFQAAQRLGLSMPATQFVDPGGAPWVVPNDLHYPVVLKPARSRIATDGHWLSTSVKVAHSRADADRIIAQHAWFQHNPFLVQEYIHGQGQGIFALYNHGRPVGFFAHKRLREKPPEGGVSVLSESVPVAEHMRQIAEALLTPIGWHGVAMVEFKVSGDGTPYLMEINGRFWGSLQLAIDAGVDFPYLLYRLAIGQPVGPVGPYKIGVKSRWLLGDLDHLYLKLKAPRAQVSLAEKLKSIARFCLPYQRGMRYEINRLHDLGPFLFELRAYFRH
jgi:predicted ATP-grasp superfamily ATP-dependent carboligase